MRFVITTVEGKPGARLSRPGHWGNIPLDSVEAAEREARRIAGTIDIQIERERGRK